MPVAVSYPGVYIQEVSSGVRTITGVATSIAAFVDFFAAGPLGPSNAVQIFSFADFERQFGGLDTRSEASYAIQQFFLNGGSEAYVIRATSSTNPAAAAAITLEDNAGSPVLTITAASPGPQGVTVQSPGAWGNLLRVDVDYGTTNPGTFFNLTVTQYQRTPSGQLQQVAAETYRNLVLDSSQPNDAVSIINHGSQVVTVASQGTNNRRPAQTGTVGSAIHNGAIPALTAGDTMTVSLNGQALANPLTVPAIPANPTLAQVAGALQSALQAVDPSLAKATVTVVGSASSTAWLQFKSGTPDPNNPGMLNAPDVLTFADGQHGTPATALGLNAATAANVQQYALGEAHPARFESGAVAGSDGGDPAHNVPPIDANGLIGDQNQKTGIYALLDVDLFNILCIPATMKLDDQHAAQVATDATNFCTTRRAMYLFDVPGDVSDSVSAIMNWLDKNAGLRSKNAALYFPRVDIADPLAGFRLRKVAPSGTVAGLWARTDGARGVWKAPAGTEATLTGVQQLEYRLTDPENGVLNPLAINCLRNFPIYGPVCWGARTLNGADQMSDEYKYIPVRRLALFIEESLYRGTQWVVFEPNDEPLWAQIRLNVGAFMQTLFRQGAFQGSTPQDAYFVLCDATTNPQASINLGIVSIVVGFAPLKPAEFVIITIKQIAGPIAT
jgi:phage tail sheath protein FI